MAKKTPKKRRTRAQKIKSSSRRAEAQAKLMKTDAMQSSQRKHLPMALPASVNASQRQSGIHFYNCTFNIGQQGAKPQSWLDRQLQRGFWVNAIIISGGSGGIWGFFKWVYSFFE